MTQLRRDAAYIRRDARRDAAIKLTAFEEEVYDLLSTAHTVKSATKTLVNKGQCPPARSLEDWEADLESRVADSMLHLLQVEHIELSPDS